MEPRRPSRASVKQALAARRSSRSSTDSRRSASYGSKRRPSTFQATIPESSGAAAAEDKAGLSTVAKPLFPAEPVAVHGAAKALRPGAFSLPTTSAPQGQGANGPTQSMTMPRHLSASQPLHLQRKAAGEKPNVTEDDERPTHKRLFALDPSGTRALRTVAIMVLVAFGATALLLLAMAALHTKSPPSTTPLPFLVCDTADCVKHAAELTKGEPTSLDPCEDFGLFVCSAWAQKHAVVSRSMTEQMVFESLFRLTELSDAAAGGDASMQGRPVDMMGLCLTARSNHDSGSLNSFKEFLANNVGFLSTSGTSATYAQLLEALVVLSTRWLVPLWFRLDVITGFVVVHPESLVPVWRRLHENLRPTYSSYVERFVDIVYDGGRNSSQALKSYLRFLRQRSDAVQATVFERLSVTVSDDSPIPVHGHVGDLELFTPKFAASSWAAAMSRAYGKQLGETLTVYVSARELLDAMNQLVSSTSALELLYHTRWWFVQQIGGLASNMLFSATGSAFGDAGNVYQRLLCSIQVSVTYGVLLASMHSAKFLSAERQAVEDILNTVHSVAVEKLRSSDNLPRFQLDSLISVLVKDASPVLWPLPSTFDAISMGRLYGGQPDGSRAFFGHWQSSREELARSLGSYPHTVASQFYKVDPSSLSIYNPVLRKVAVATAALASPLYYRKGTTAMIYAGLGFEYATRLTRVMEMRKLSDAAIWQESPVATEEDSLALALRCSDEREKVRAFPFLPALAVAHGAYEKMVNGTEEMRLKGMEGYTAEQVFFMTACLSLCQVDRADHRWSSGCNAAVRNYAPFANAFRCQLGSGMNRREKCTFLTG